MTKRLRLPILLLLITALAVVLLASCTSVGVLSVQVKEYENENEIPYKTDYVIGDELDLTGLELVVTRTDGEVYTVKATEVRDELKILNFKTDKVDEIAIVIEYKGVSTSLVINVRTPEDAAIKHTVTFVTGQNATALEPVSVGNGAYVPTIETPVRDGYVFDGWYTAKDYNENSLWDFQADMVDRDVTLYAKWAKLYTITFIDEINGNPDIVKYVKEGGTLTDIPQVPHREGENGSWVEKNPDGSVSLREGFVNIWSNVSVYAHYEVSLYKVVFYRMQSDGITPFNLKVFNDVPHGTNLAELYADEIASIDTTSPDAHKHFFKWSLEYTNIVSDLNICALYETNTYDVTFDLNYDCEDTVYDVATGITYNNPVSRPAANPVREGYDFDGWYNGREGDDEQAWSFNTSRIKGNTTLYAKWTKLYTVNFVVDTTIAMDDVDDTRDIVTIDDKTYYVYYTYQVRKDSGVSKPAVPVRTGYDASWDIENAALQKITSDTNVLLAFTIKTFKVTFYNFDRTVIKLHEDDPYDYQLVEYLGSAIAPTSVPTRDGYEFSGWDDVDYTRVTHDLEVTANFTPNTYEVIVYPNNGVSAQRIEVVFDSRIDAEKLNYQYPNYHFVGWYTDSSFVETSKWDVNSDTLQVVGDGALVLYAKWLKIHTVSFYDDSSAQIATERVINGEFVTNIPQIPEVEGRTGDWYERNEDYSISNAKFDFSNPITKDTQIQIVYTINKYLVNFYKDIGQLHHSMEVEFGKSVADMVQIDDPYLEGRTFISWDKPLDYVITQATDFNAVYSINVYTVTWGEGSTITTEVEYGKPAIFPSDLYDAPTQEGKNLQGWRVVEPLVDDDGEPYTVEFVRTDMVVAPVWSDQRFGVEFRDRETNDVYKQNVGSEELDKQTLSYGQFVEIDTTVPNPEKVGKDFVGWEVNGLRIKYDVDSARWIYDNPNGGTDGVFEISGVSVSLIIKGSEIYYTTVETTNLATQINRSWASLEKTRLYATEEGWKYGDSQEDLTDSASVAFSGRVYYAIQQETIFFARHEVSTFAISYVTNVSGVTIDDDIYEYNALSVAPEVASRYGYVFLGWYTDADFNNKYVFGTPVASDLTLYARWEASHNGTIGLVYTLNESGTAYSVTGFSAGYNTGNVDVVVANYYNGLPVDSIGAEAFADTSKNFNIATISLPNTLVNIGPSAFMNMTALTEISIPEMVTIIPDNAFNGATALTTVNFGDKSGVTTIGKNAFARNTSLKYSVVNGVKTIFTLPSLLETIESGAFYNCLSFTEIYIPGEVKTIGDNAFAGANNLRYAVFSKNAPANIGANVFQNYTSLQNAFRIYVPNVANYTGAAANENWKLLKDKICDVNLISVDKEWAYRLNTDGSVILVQYLGDDTQLDIPMNIVISSGNATVSTIGDYCLDGTITSVEMLSSIAISQNTFGSADSLKKLIISVTDVNAINANYIYDAYTNVASLDTLAISPSITIPELFGGAAPTALTSVETLDTHNYVIEGFLANCVYVQNVIINGVIREIGANAFLNCTALVNVTFDNTQSAALVTIGSNAFNGAISLETFVVDGGADGEELPASVTTIGEGAFDGTRWLGANKSDMIIVGNGILYRYRGQEAVVMIPETVTSITPSAFENNTTLRQVYVENPESALLSQIGDSAFENCVNLESAVLPANLSTISYRAFAGNTKLATIVLFGQTLPRLYGNVQEGTHVFSDARSNISFYVKEEANANWSYDFIKVTNLTLYDGATADEKWVYAKAGGGTGIMLIKSLSAGESLVVPENLNNNGVYEMADYALPRTLKSLSYSTRILNYGDATFAGVTFLEELTIYNNANANHRVEASALMSLLSQNPSISVVNTVSSIAISTLIGGTLPENVKTVNVLATETNIATSFLENNQYVENINVTIDGVTYALEDTVNVASTTITKIGAKAFRNTKWMENLESEFVVVLGGNLVDYKGKNSVLEIGDNVTEINGSIFENDMFIEIVYVPASVTKIGDKAFYGASKLTKVFFEGTTVPTLQVQSFDSNQFNDKGLEVYVPASAHSAYLSATNWTSAKPQSDSGIVHFKNVVSEKTTASAKSVVYNEYILSIPNAQESNARVLLNRTYTENYSVVSGVETLQSVVETTSIAVPASVEYNGTTYNVVGLGNNVFMSAVDKVAISLLATINSYTFKNLGDIDTITINDIDLANRQISGTDLINVFDTHNTRAIAYDGSVQLSALFGATNPAELSALSAVRVVESVTETVDEMLVGWVNISDISFPSTIQKVGINSLEDTAWYTNYTSTTYGDFVVLGGSLLYKYKGSAGGTIRVPDQVLIVNTGAFSSFDGESWKSNLSASEISFSLENSKAHTIYDYAFAGCKNLKNITLPSSMRRIAASAFEGTLITAENDMLQVSGSDAKEGITLIKYYGTAETFVIPSKVKKIAAGAFADNLTIKTLRYDYNTDSILTTICEDAFNGAVNLTDIYLPATLVNVGKDAFFNTTWFANQLASGKDVTIGSSSKTILYQKNTAGSSYTLTSNIISVTEDALLAMDKSFLIDGVIYGATNSNITVTDLSIASGAKISQQEMYSIMSKVESVRTNGQVKLSTLIGSDEPLDNVKRLSFFSDMRITSIVAEYAYGWTSVEKVDTIPFYITSIGEKAFEGTTWYENLSGNANGIVFAGGDSGSGVIIKYVGNAENVVINYATGISADAFRGNENVKSITFTANTTLTEIPANCFRDCVNLENIVLSDSIVKYGEKAFENTAWLSNYESDFLIMDGTLIAYKGEGGAIVIPEEVKAINSYVFSGNDTITSVTFDTNCIIDTIGANWFRDCVNLEEIILNEYVTHVERSALEGTKWLSQASVGSNPALYYENTYFGIKRIVLYVGTSNTYRVPSDVTEIMPTAFSGVSSLGQLIFVEGKLTEITDGAFEGCTSLTMVTLVDNIVYVGERAFAGTPWLAKQTEAEFVILSGKLVKYNGTATEVVLPSGISAIEKGVFDGKGITSLDMSATVIERLEENVFNGLSTLASVVFSPYTTYVGAGALNGTAWLNAQTDDFVIVNDVALVAYNGSESTIEVPDSVRYLNSDVLGGNSYVDTVIIKGEIAIGDRAFVGTSLYSLIGENYIQSIGKDAFLGTEYESINLSGVAPDGEAQTENIFLVIGGHLVKFECYDPEVVIPKDVTYIPEGIFSGNTQITSVDFSKVTGALTIEPNAFRNATNLKDITFSDKIDYIGMRAFYNTKWQNNTTDEIIVTANGKLLAYIAEGTTVKIPATVKSFARDVFKGNTNITTIEFAQGATVNIPEEAFKGCTSLVNVTFPRVAFEVGVNAFENTAWLRKQGDYVVVNGMLIGYKGTSTDILIPSTVTYIYDYVFKGNEQITSLAFANGTNISTIKGETFVGCSNLKDVTFRTTLETLDMGAFEGTAWKTNLQGTTFVTVGTKILAYIGVGGAVQIPGGIDTIALNAFAGNTTITSVSFEAVPEFYVIPAGVFAGCTNLATVTFPEYIKGIGKDAFKDTAWLNALKSDPTFTGEQESCFTIDGKMLFYAGSSTSAIFLPESVTHISATAFEGLSVGDLYVSATDPSAITIEEGALDNVSSIIIVAEHIDAFRTAAGWSDYALKMVAK
ncbi:MAG: leucine-rich repeat protein [Clostridia bacterium]|nr:leucine-rich repeat protein [Clostridia bacterium]